MEINKTITELRTRISALQAERRELSSHGRNRDEAVAYISRKVDELEAAAEKQCCRNLRLLAAGESVDLLHADASSSPYGGSNIGPHLVGLLGREAVMAYLCKHLDEEVPGGLSAEGREARLLEIESELDPLERQEEILIEESELGESPVMRRADARPEIILGTHDVPESPGRSPNYMGRAASEVPDERRRMVIEPSFPSRA